jgi:hypothetical protein
MTVFISCLKNTRYSPPPLTGTLTDLKKAFQLEEVFHLEIIPIILLTKLHCILKLLNFVVK